MNKLGFLCILLGTACIEATPITGSKGGVVDIDERPEAALEDASVAPSSALPPGNWGSNSCNNNDIICFQSENLDRETCEDMDGEFQSEPCAPATAGMCELPNGVDEFRDPMLVFFYLFPFDTGFYYEAGWEELCEQIDGTFYP